MQSNICLKTIRIYSYASFAGLFYFVIRVEELLLCHKFKWISHKLCRCKPNPASLKTYSVQNDQNMFSLIFIDFFKLLFSKLSNMDYWKTYQNNVFLFSVFYLIGVNVLKASKFSKLFFFSRRRKNFGLNWALIVSSSF